MTARPFLRPSIEAARAETGALLAEAVADVLAREIDHDILHGENDMKMDGWIFHSESAHRDGVQLTFAPAPSTRAKGTFNLTCKREDVKQIVGDLRPGDYVEISVGPGKAPAAPARS